MLPVSFVATLAGCCLALVACTGGRPLLLQDEGAPSPFDRTTRVATCEDLSACLALLNEQARAWNEGDLDAFVEGYAPIDELVFAGPDSVHVGYAAMVQRYRDKYGDRAAMGRLVFADTELHPQGADHVRVSGTWLLERKDDRPWGRYVLVLRRFAEGWLIVLDYTSLEGDADRI
jgi:beta-aspartyl-peptidase (threonine type)